MAHAPNAQSTATGLSDVTILVPRLVRLFIKQLTEGCGDVDCPMSTCYTHLKSYSDRPLRKYTDLSATAIAFWLANVECPVTRLCPIMVPEFYGVLGEVQLAKSPISSQSEDNPRRDVKSFSQQLFDTKTVNDFLNQTHQQPALVQNDPWSEFDDAVEAAWHYISSPPHLAPLGVAAFLTCIEIIGTRLSNHNEVTELETIDIPLDERSLDCAQSLTQLWFHLIPPFRTYREEFERRKINDETVQSIRETVYNTLKRLIRKELRESSKEELPRCRILRIASSFFHVFLRSWSGDSEIGELSTPAMALIAIKELQKLICGIPEASKLESQFWCLSDSRQRDPIEYATTWLEHRPGTVSVLEYPWLFKPSELVTFFRAICFRRMENAVEEAHLNLRLLVTGMAWHSNEAPQIRQLITGTLRTATSRSLAIQVRRHELLNDLFDQLWRRELRELLRPIRVEIVNEGEEGLDQGGVAQELFQSALDEILKPSYGMFKVDPTTRMTWFDPAANGMIPAHKFEILGVLFALSVHNGFVLPVTFPLALYRALLYRSCKSLEDIEDGWPDLVKGLRQLKDWTEGDVGDIFARSYVFSFETFDTVVHVDLSKNPPNGDEAVKGRKIAEEEAPLVTNKNRDDYIRDYILYLTYDSIESQLSAFKMGFQSLIGFNLLCALTPRALQILVEGHQLIDIDALEKETTYDGGYTASSETVVNFWALIRNFDDEWKRRLLEFVTASDRLPVSGVKGLGLVIQRNGGDDERLPTSMTCFSRLLLPEYRSKETLKQRLLVALGESKGFGLR